MAETTSADMDTFTKIKNVFYSGMYAFQGEPEIIKEISFLIDNDYLLLDKILIGSKKEYESALKESTTNQIAYDAAGGGYAHIALKLMAGKYLQSKSKPFLYEQLFCGFYPDVISEDKAIVIECGHTQNPEKMLCYFQQGQIGEFLQIPYPTIDDFEIIGYRFVPGIDLYEFLSFLEKEKRRDIREIFNKRHE